MTQELIEFRSRILGIFADSGILAQDPGPDEDIDLRDFIEDSIQFVSAVVEIENQFDIELHDELLSPESLASINGFCTSLWELIHA